MNEQNNNIHPNPQPMSGDQPPVQPESQNFNTPASPVAPMQEQSPISPSMPQAQPNPPVQPIQPVQPVQQTTTPNVVEQQPVQPINPNAQNVVPQGTPIQNVQPIVQQPIQSENVVSQPSPMNNMNGQPNIAPQQAPINPVINETRNPNTPINGVFAPSVPIGGASDVTNVGFVAASSEIPKKKKPLLIIGIIVIILAILGAIGYFVVYPYIMKNYFSDPKNVYETSIKSAFKGLNTTVNDLVHNKGIYNLEVSLDSNVETMAEYEGYTYGINLGIDPSKKTLQEGIYVKNNKTKAEHSYYSYLKDNKYYDKYSSYRDYIYLGESDTNSILSMFDKDALFKQINELNSEEANYIVNKISDLLIESIDEEKLTKEDASITINGETLKVTDNKYELNYETIKKTVEFVRDGLTNDDKAIEILAKISNIEKETIKENLNSIKVPEKNEENDFSFTTSIYTYGNKNEIIGFALKEKDEHVNFYYYSRNNIVDSKLTISYKDNYNKNETIVIKISATKDKSNTNVVVNYDNKDIDDSNKGKELLTLTIRTWNEQGIDFDYNIKIEDEKYNGTIKFIKDVNNDRAKYSFDFSVKNGNEYIEINIGFTEDWTSEVANINTTAAVTLTDEEILTHRTEFINALKSTPLGKALTTVSNDYDPSIKDYYDQNNPYDFNNTLENQEIENSNSEI